MSRSARAVPVIPALALALGACSSSPASHSSASGFLRIGTTDLIDSLNPFVTTEQTPLNTFPNIYPQLVQDD